MSKSAKHPPPRRKSCSECVKAKRRCDHGLPSCERCNKLRLVCRYVTTLAHSSHSHCSPATETEPVVANIHTFEATALETMHQADSLCALVDFNRATNEAIGTYDILPDFTDCFSPTIGGSTSLDITLSRIKAPVYNVNLSNLSAVIDQHLKFGIDQMKLAPRGMVLENGTPWSHPLLYDAAMPRSIQGMLGCGISRYGVLLLTDVDAHAACALYLTKNETNGRLVSRHIEFHADELLLSGPPTAGLELLAWTQALMLYQIIRIFDGDVSFSNYSFASAARH